MFTRTNKTLPAHLSASEQNRSPPLTRTLSTASTHSWYSWHSTIKNIGKMSLTESLETSGTSTPASKFPVSMCGDPLPGAPPHICLPSSNTTSSVCISKGTEAKGMSAESKSSKQRADAIDFARHFDMAQSKGPLKVTDPEFQRILNEFREEQKIKDAAEKRDRELKEMVVEEDIPRKSWMRKIGLGRLGKPKN